MKEKHVRYKADRYYNAHQLRDAQTFALTVSDRIMDLLGRLDRYVDVQGVAGLPPIKQELETVAKDISLWTVPDPACKPRMVPLD